MSDKLQKKPEPAEFLLYQTEGGQTRLEVRLQKETVWLSQKRMAELFQKNVRTINEHIQNIFDEGELTPESVIRNFRITADDGKPGYPFCGKEKYGATHCVGNHLNKFGGKMF